MTSGGPEISVVVPTRNRCPTLANTLDRLARQDLPPRGFEVVVVDNGSSDGTAELLKEVAAAFPVPFHHAYEPAPGPAVARNTGLRLATGPVVLFLGDDMEPATDSLVSAHAKLHRERPDPRYAVLGRATWNPRYPITPFMHWLENGGPQFHFWRLSPGPVPAQYYFYTPQLSIKRELLDEVGWFDERFTFAALEDIELGVRMAEAGIVLDYHPDLLVLHDHPATLKRTLERAKVTGRSAALYNQLFPERPHPDLFGPHGFKWQLLRVGTPLLHVAARLPLPGVLRRKSWHLLHRAAYGAGYRVGPPALLPSQGPPAGSGSRESRDEAAAVGLHASPAPLAERDAAPPQR